MFSAVADALPGETTVISFGARVYRAWCLALLGRLDESETAALGLLREAVALGWTSSLHALPAHLTLAMINLLRAEERAAYREVMAGLAATVGVTELWPTVALHLTRASTAAARGRRRAAAASFENALALRGARPVPRALADMWLRTEVDVSLLAQREPDLPLLTTGEGGSRSATSLSSSARLALAHSDLETADTAADRALHSLRGQDPMQDLGDVLGAIEAHLVRAVVTDRRRRPRESSLSLLAALQLARPQRLLQPLLATDPQRTALITQRALADGVVHADDFVRTLLARLGPQPVASPEPDLVEPLTERELAVLAELATWKSNAEIAAEFYVSVNTVKSHLQHLFRKLGVTNRRQAVRRARGLGLIS
jgi:LuxR family maltose regulon positive regulatory protein